MHAGLPKPDALPNVLMHPLAGLDGSCNPTQWESNRLRKAGADFLLMIPFLGKILKLLETLVLSLDTVFIIFLQGILLQL